MNIQQITKDAEAGDMEAQWNLSNMYYQGDDITKDDEKAFYWASKSAAQGHTSSQFNLGCMHYHGKATSQDYEKAFFLV